MPRPVNDSPRARPTVTPTRVLVGVLLCLPVVAPLWVASYTSIEPRLAGFPFFYWYQLLWIVLSVVCTASAYVLLQRERRGHAGATAPHAAADVPAGLASNDTSDDHTADEREGRAP